MRLYVALALTLLAPQIAAAQTPPPAPHIKPEDRIQVSPHVHVIPDKSVPLVTNIGIIVGDRAVLVVDTGMGPPNGAKVLAEAQKLSGTRALYPARSPEVEEAAQHIKELEHTLASYKRSAVAA